MSQQYLPNGGRGSHNGRSSGQGGRGTGRGGGMVPQQQQQQQQQLQPGQPQPPPPQSQLPQQQQYNNYQTGGRDRGGSRPISAWQQTQQAPTQGSSLQQQAAAAAGGYQVVSLQQQPQQPPAQSQGRPMSAAGGYAPMGNVPYYNPYGGAGHPGQWPGQPAYMTAPHQQTSRGMYYPPSGQPVVPTLIQGPIPQSQVSQPIAPREKKPLVITVC
jgi:hypothetical protein